MRSISSKLWEIADCLDMRLNVQGTVIFGDMAKLVVIEGIAKLPVPMKVVSSLLTSTEVAVVCRGVGNLALLVIPGEDQGTISIHVIDVAKLTVKPDSCIENRQLKTVEAVVAMVKHAVVKQFARAGQVWAEVEGTDKCSEYGLQQTLPI